MEPGDIDKLMKFKFSEEERGILKDKFIKGAKLNSNVKEAISKQLFEAMALYMFNKGHGAGYALISEWQMYHKVKHPTEFWYATAKHEVDERKQAEFMCEAANEGILFFLPHVNYTASFSIREVDGEKAIQMGYNGPFRSYDDFYERCKSRAVTSRVIESLFNDGALEFNKKTYLSRTVKFNSTLYLKGARR
jgi:DNA polymerase III alpha subunit